MVDKLLHILNDKRQNYPFWRLQLVVHTLDTQLNEPNNQNSIKVPKLLCQRIRNRFHKTLETSVINYNLCKFCVQGPSALRG